MPAVLRLRRVVLARRLPEAVLRLVEVPLDEEARRLVAADVRRPVLRLLVEDPIFVFWPRDDAPGRVRLADFIRLVAIA